MACYARSGIWNVPCTSRRSWYCSERGIEDRLQHIDGASIYNNEKEIGIALKEVFSEGKIKREDLFITSKLLPANKHPDEVIPCLNRTLADLQLKYLDLYLVHLPVPMEYVNDKPQVRRLNGYGLQDIWRKMEQAYTDGLVKALGVSNYNATLLSDILNYAKIPPTVNQIERHPYLVQEKFIKICQDNNIQITAYASLGAPGFLKGSVTVLENQTIKDIAHHHKKTPAQVLIRWSIDSNIIAIPKSTNPQRIAENFNVWDFKLSLDEIKRINALDQNLRGFNQDWYGYPTFL